MTPKQFNELNRQADVIEQHNQYSETLERVMQHNAINAHLKMVNDCKDKLPTLAKDLHANNHRVEWSVYDEGDGIIEYKCRVQCTFGRLDNYHCGSYVSATHTFEAAEVSIREMHSKWLADSAVHESKREEDSIKERLYQDYLAKNSGRQV